MTHYCQSRRATAVPVDRAFVGKPVKLAQIRLGMGAGLRVTASSGIDRFVVLGRRRACRRNRGLGDVERRAVPG
jgi:hypothetical protein